MTLFLRIGIALELAWLAAVVAPSAKAGSLGITYTVKQNQTAIVGPGFAVVDLTSPVL